MAFKTFRAAAVCQNAEFSFGPFCRNTIRVLEKVEFSTPESFLPCGKSEEVWDLVCCK